MREFKFDIGNIVKIVNGGLTYPYMSSVFKKLHFKNKEFNRWRYHDYYTHNDEYFITNSIYYSYEFMYKIVNIKDSNIEFLINEKGLELISKSRFFKIKVL